MNQLSQVLAQAQKRGRRKQIAVYAALAVLVLALAGAALVERTDRIDVWIGPQQAAEVATVEVAEGYGLVRRHTVWALKGHLVLHVAAEGYVPETTPITAAARGREEVDVILRALPATLRATAAPAQPQTQWLIDGTLVATGESLERKLPAGTYTLTARHPHFAPAEQVVTALNGADLTVVLPLAPLAGRISLSSVPQGASVTVNGAAAGQTPVDIEIAGGVHAVKLERPGYQSRSAQIAITNQTPAVTREFSLARTQKKVTFTLSPGGGVLAVNGRAVTAKELTLDTGVAHRARYGLAGYAPQEVTFTLAPGGEEKLLELVLEPILGTVFIQSEPEAEVALGGKPVGPTPLALQLPTTRHSITLTREGYRPETRSFTPEAHRPRTVSATLLSEAEFRRQTAPPQYVNTTGIAMKLFRDPGIVTLGAPRGEEGRRPNEFLRKVQLPQSFYAGVHEVTVEQYQRFRQPGQPPGKDRRPVTGVSWEDAARFCNWLSQQEKLTPVYRFSNDRHVASNPAADGYRLLTEAEWEWLARDAGRNLPTLFPWGDQTVIPEKSGNLADESARQHVPVYIPGYDDGYPGLAPVGSFTANPAGLHDLAGNVREWTHDRYAPLLADTDTVATDRLDHARGAERTMKGSSWRSGSLAELRAAWRAVGSVPLPDLGFRVARFLVGGI